MQLKVMSCSSSPKRVRSASKWTAFSVSPNCFLHLCEGPVNRVSGDVCAFHWNNRLQTSSECKVTDSAAPWRLPDLVRPKAKTAGPLAVLTDTCRFLRLSSSPVLSKPWKATSRLSAKIGCSLKRLYPTIRCRASKGNGGARFGISCVTHVFIKRQLSFNFPLRWGWASWSAARRFDPQERPWPWAQRASR